MTFHPAASPLGLLLLHDLLALLSPALVDGVPGVVDLKSVLVLHVGVLDFSGLLIKLQNVSHPESDRDKRRGFKSGSNLTNYCKHSALNSVETSKRAQILLERKRASLKCQQTTKTSPYKRKRTKEFMANPIQKEITESLLILG